MQGIGQMEILGQLRSLCMKQYGFFFFSFFFYNVEMLSQFGMCMQMLN